MSNIMFEEAELEALQGFYSEEFTEYKNQREDIDEAYELCDWMYKCGTARGEFLREKRRWVPRFVDGKANLGSVLMHRQVNTLAGILCGILLSGRDLFQFRDKEVRGNPDAEETGQHTADCMNALAKWVLKQDGFEQKIPEFCTAIFKQSNVFAMISMRKETARVVESETIAEEEGKDGEGRPYYRFSKRTKVREGEKFSFPSVTFPYARNIYANKYISRIRDQERVFVLSVTSRNKLLREAEWFDKDAMAKIDWDEIWWDGQNGAEGKQSDAEHLHRDDISPRKGPILRWDIYDHTPMLKKEVYNPEKHKGSEAEIKVTLTWSTWIGNALDSALCIRAIPSEEFDPDGEIPIKEIRANADDGDMLYHTTLAETVRSPYSADCALLNAAVDNVALINDPPKTVIPGMHRIKDFTNKSGQLWQVQTHEAIKDWPVRDSTSTTVTLREQIREDAKLALATDDARVGQYAGARTSATEVLQVTGNTDTTIALRNAYIIGQILPWIARKYVSYCREFMEPELIQRVLNEQMPGRVYGDTIGEYDIVADIMTQYESDERLELRLDKAMQILTNPALAQSETHKTDIGELLRMYMDHLRLRSGRVILPPNDADSEANARGRVHQIIESGVYVPPVEGENVRVHLRIARAERLRWRGVDPARNPKAKNAELLDQYIKDLQQMEKAGVGVPQMGGEAPQTPGMEEGGAIAEMMGGDGGPGI